jgi:archaellum component FlaC
MENENRIVELLAESLIKFDALIEGHNALIEGQKATNEKLDSMDSRLDRVEREIVKLNLQTTENTRAIFKLATEVESIAHLHERVSKLEKEVYK